MSQVRVLQRPRFPGTRRRVGSVGYPCRVDPLLELQRIDTAILRLERRRSEIESGKEAAAARAAAEAAESALGEIRLAVDEVARDQSRIEHEVDSLAAKIEAEQRRLYDGSISVPKELEALQHEIAGLNERKARLEDELLGLMERREELDARAAVADGGLVEARARLDGLLADSASELERIAGDLEGLAGERGPAAAVVDAELLELYEELRAAKHGVGAAALVDGTCQACNERLSAMELDRLRKAEGVKRCEHCRRILIA